MNSHTLALHHETLRRTPGTMLAWLIVTMILACSALAVPNYVNYQGRLTDAVGENVADSTYQIAFTIWNDSIGGAALWSELTSVNTNQGRFTHMLGTVSPFTSSLFEGNSSVWLGMTVGGEAVLPRVLLSAVPYARASGAVAASDSLDSLVIITSADAQTLEIRSDKGKRAMLLSGDLFGAVTLYDSTGKVSIALRGNLTGDGAVIVPDSSISSQELLDEPAIAVNYGVDLVPLSTLTMTDLVTVEITTPADGFIILHGKCYVLLSGTTGANTALIQIDSDPGGSSQFPWFTMVGLAGYVNTQTNYFPVYVTRAYYADKGTYEFRLEGRANNFAPAAASSWDHVLTAIFYPTAMDAVAATVSNPSGFQNAIPLPIDTLRNEQSKQFRVDLREKLLRK